MAVLEAIGRYLKPRSTTPTPLQPAERLARQRVLAAERAQLAAEKEASAERHAPRLAVARQEMERARSQVQAAAERHGHIAFEARTEASGLDRRLTAVEHEFRTLADPAIGDFLDALEATLSRRENVGLKTSISIGWAYDHRRLGPVQVPESNGAALAEVLAEFRNARREVEALVFEPIAQDELCARLSAFRERLIAFASARGFRVLWQEP